MQKPKIQVILGSIRQGRSGEKVAQWFMDSIKENPDAVVELIDLKDFPMPLFDDAQPPSARSEGFVHHHPVVQKWLQKISEADGYIIITAEYNHSVPGALKNAIDFGYKEWNDKSVGFVSYESLAGGSRAVEHLRQIASELQMHDIREQILIPNIWAAFDENGNLSHAESLAKSANNILTKVSDLARKLRV